MKLELLRSGSIDDKGKERMQAEEELNKEEKTDEEKELKHGKINLSMQVCFYCSFILE